MRSGLRDGLLLAGKTVLFILGGICIMAALVDLVVTGPTWRGVGFLAFGLLLAGVPLGFALRDAIRHARRRKVS